MPTREQEHWAKEAARLESDETFNKAMDDIKAEALEKLSLANVEEPNEIIRLQQRVQVVEEIRSTLGMYIGAAESPDAGPVT